MIFSRNGRWGLLALLLWTGSLSAETIECAKAVPGFDPKNPAVQKGVFNPGTRLELGEYEPTSKMYRVRFLQSDGTSLEMLCHPADIGQVPPGEATTVTKDATAPAAATAESVISLPSSKEEDIPPLFLVLKNLDPMIWKVSREVFKPAHKPYQFKAVSKTEPDTWRSDAPLKFLSHKTYETLAHFTGDHLDEITILVFSRGDARKDLDQEEFNQMLREVEASLDGWMGSKGVIASVPAEATELNRKSWFKVPLRVNLDSSFTRSATDESWDHGRIVTTRYFRGEFIRIGITPYDGSQSVASLIKPNYQAPPQSAIVKKAELKDRVSRKDNGDVHLLNVPMVDQGDKGYCVVATVERVLRYYGLDVDQNELAKVANTQTDGGTSTEEMYAGLKKMGSRMRFSPREYPRIKEKAHMQKVVIDAIDQGMPVLWSVQLGLVQETPKLPQFGGYHMRLIIGYNKGDSKVIYTDSWGAKHEFKYMLLKDAFLITKGLYTVTPN